MWCQKFRKTEDVYRIIGWAIKSTCLLFASLFFHTITLHTLNQHGRQQRQLGYFFIRHNNIYNASFLSVYYLLELSTQYLQYFLRYLLEILQF
jgi:hypothetical protein